MKLNFVPLIATIMTLLPVWAAAQPTVTFHSGQQQTQLIELYTSEGCSSCPPADRWFTQLGEDDGLWTDYVPVAFHVTYWNFLGWRDALSDRAFDQRQRRRAASADSGVYTPGVFRDGAEFRQWRELPSAPTGASSTPAGQLTLTIEGNDLVARFAPPPGQRDLELEVAVLSNDISSSVKAGENRGRSLRHDFVVVDLQRQALIQDHGIWHVRLPLPATQGVSKPALAAWVNDANGQPLQATGGWLP